MPPLCPDCGGPRGRWRIPRLVRARLRNAIRTNIKLTYRRRMVYDMRRNRCAVCFRERLAALFGSRSSDADFTKKI